MCPMALYEIIGSIICIVADPQSCPTTRKPQYCMILTQSSMKFIFLKLSYHFQSIDKI